MPAADPLPFDLTDQASFAFFSHETPRLCDTDLFQHVNNVAHAAMHETGRVRYMAELVKSVGKEFGAMMLAHVALDFRRDLYWPNPVRLGARIMHVGRTSVRIGVGCFDADGCVTTSQNVIVQLGEDRRPLPIEGDLRTLLERERDGADLFTGNA